MRCCHLERLSRLMLLAGLVSASGAAADDRVPAPAVAATAVFQRGLTSFHQRDFEKAIAAFREAFAIDPRASFLFAIAQAQRLQGDCEQAIVSYRDFLRADPSPRQARLAERLMGKPCTPAVEMIAPARTTSVPKVASIELINPPPPPTAPNTRELVRPVPPIVEPPAPPIVEPPLPPIVPEIVPKLVAHPSRHRQRHWYRDPIGLSFAGAALLVGAAGAGLFGVGHGWIASADGATSYARFAMDAPRAADGPRYEDAAIGLFAAGGALLAVATIRLTIVGRRR